MHVDIIRQDGKLYLENIHCDCANTHAVPQMDIFIQPGLIERCADCITQSGLGKTLLLIADSTTYEIAGKTIAQNLKNEGFACHECVLTGGHINPTPEMAEQIVSHVDADTDFLLSVGSGVVTDLTRYSASLARLPFAVFGTAASMDGYTSVSSSMLIDGMKVSVYGQQASLLMFDPIVLASAPLMMQAAGVGDVLAKYNVIVDWKLGSAVNGELFCPLCEELLTTALNICVDSTVDIIERNAQGMTALIESLILAGMTGLMIGSTRSVSSIEHNMSHYWEMMKLAYGGNAPSHGISVGIGLIYSLIMHDVLRSADLSKIDKQKIKADRMSKSDKDALFSNNYPGDMGNEIKKANADWYLEWSKHEAHIDALTAYHEQYKKDCAILPGYRDIAKCLALFGAPTSAAKAGIGKERLKSSLLSAKDFRIRYNIGKALDTLGLHQEAVDKIMKLEDIL